VKRTGDIGLISVVSDSGVAAGVRRLEALTGRAARKAANATMQAAQQVATDILRVSVADMPSRITQLLDERRKLERDLAEAKKKLAMGGGGKSSGDDGIRTVGDIKLLARAVSGIDIKDLKGLADEGKKQVGSGVVALVATSDDGKGSIVVGVTSDLVSRFSAVDLVRKASEVLGGKGGGGKPDMAQAGGPDGSKADAALKAIEAALGAG
jgi:alanyl-tRNA synthetase